ncbi:hypothetical protein POM88_019095 [Heracleum sosnowskyi]|uniref:Uncharacterized protein n=1 Tax=Heracleum sosnowskyi TaxID=360622 RepID=A0AAD8N014_9APIA|nr:hypothetical protein POM88_019080 [Heracleum sosnowskyi]KAK1390905.1 hypothetical protein POM88_019083 [Heracleum sosnowskyi]KAK1390908.1 hypothetical protein POM88_019086 [Heracleum sosnowskyi]KAK1390911.1 hypothetical protein POM88_019089 [Heracleum sosnowskyi]KAK1390914.1 hypothetical protein POM88_019092 [Heracleum sosnowskyi]
MFLVAGAVDSLVEVRTHVTYPAQMWLLGSEYLLANPVNVEWSSISVELCGGTNLVILIVKPTSPRILDSVDVGGNQAKDEGVGSQGEQSTTVCEQFDTDDGESEEDEVGDDNLGSSKSESIDCFRFPESQESRSYGLERCVGFNGDGLSDSPVGIDLIMACLCSFCTKAAYIWSDLHYQDLAVHGVQHILDYALSGNDESSTQPRKQPVLPLDEVLGQIKSDSHTCLCPVFPCFALFFRLLCFR